jgi:hypothetical protein
MNDKSLARKVLAVCSIPLLITYCSSEDTAIPQTENQTFNTLLQEAPATIIDLDEVPVDTVLVTPENMLGTKRSSRLSEPAFLSPMGTRFIKIEDSLYVANRQKIFVMDAKGVWQRSVGGQGRGPGEFAASIRISHNSEYIAALDYWNGRIQVFDHNLNLLFTETKNLHDSHLSNNLALTDDFLYMGIPPHGSEDLISVYKMDDFSNKFDTFWPKIIPDGLQPGPYNTIIIDSNISNRLAITNLGLPYLFILNEERGINHLLYFDSTYYRELENPAAKPVRIEGKDEHSLPGVRSFIQQMLLNDDGTIYFTVGYNLYEVIPVATNKYQLNRAWHFVIEESPSSSENLKSIHITDMIVESDSLYFVTMSEGYLFKTGL